MILMLLIYFFHQIIEFTTPKPSARCLRLSPVLVDLDLDLLMIVPARQPRNPI